MSVTMELRLEDIATQPVRPALRHSLGVSVSGCLMGITVAFSATALDDMQDDYWLETPSRNQQMLFPAMAAGIAFFANLFFGRLTILIGKKRALMLSAIFYFVGYTVIAYSRTYTQVFVGRGITGLGVSLTCLALSPYIAEISPNKHRGKFSAIMQLQIQFGILAVSVLGALDLSFRWNASISSAIAILNLLLVVIAPETPRWLMSKTRVGEAEEVLDALMEGDPLLINDEIEVLQRTSRPLPDIPQDNFGMVPFWSKQNIKPLVIACFIMMFVQLTAINAVLADSIRIFKVLGFTEPRICTAGMSGAFFIFTFGSAALTDRAGRKLLLVVSAVLISISLSLLSLSGFLAENIHMAMLSLALGCYVFSFSMAWGSIPWVIAGEFFTLENQGRALSVVSSTNWIFNFLTVFTWKMLTDSVGGPRYVFLIYSFLTFLAAVFVGVFVPETQGLALYQIQDLWSSRSAQYVTVVHRISSAADHNTNSEQYFTANPNQACLY